MPFASIYPNYPRTNPRNFRKKILRIGGTGKWHFFGFWLLSFLKKNCFVFSLWKSAWYHLFLHYEWFLQNLEKDFIQTNMHTTVHTHKLWRHVLGIKIQKPPLHKKRISQATLLTQTEANFMHDFICLGQWNQICTYLRVAWEILFLERRLLNLISFVYEIHILGLGLTIQLYSRNLCPTTTLYSTLGRILSQSISNC